METSKLYSEVKKILGNNSHFENEVQLIEQLLLDKMEGFMNWIWNNRKDIYKIEDERTKFNNKWQYVKRDGTVLYLTEQELIQIYLNK
jgi:hypothetical protein